MTKITFRKVNNCFILLVLASLVSACSTVVDGRSQRIMVDSDPEGAYCILRSNDMVVATVTSTPQSVVVEKSKYDLIAECSKDGYSKSKGRAHSDYAVSTIGNAVFGEFGMVGSMVDSVTGASNKYDNQIFVAMERAAQPAPSAVVAAAPSAPVAPVAAAQPAMPRIIVMAPQYMTPVNASIQVAEAPVEPSAHASALEPPFE